MRKNDGKKEAIKLAAIEVFLTYGFERVTMDDIAKAADVSRPALYQHYRNKEEIYRDGVTHYATECIVAAAVAAKGPGNLSKKLHAILEAGFLGVYEHILSYPHGFEVVDARSSLAPELVRAWHVEMEKVLATVIKPPKGFTAKDLAQHLMQTIDGAKTEAKSVTEIRKSAARAVRVIVKVCET